MTYFKHVPVELKASTTRLLNAFFLFYYGKKKNATFLFPVPHQGGVCIAGSASGSASVACGLVVGVGEDEAVA